MGEINIQKKYDIDLKEEMEDIEPITFNWNFIRLCYEAWKEEIYYAWGEKVKLHQIAGISVNFLNDLCNGKKTKTFKLFNSEGYRDIQEYLMGVSQLDYAPMSLKEYITLNNLYNLYLYDKRKSNLDGKKIKSIENNIFPKYCKGNKKIDEHIKDLKESCLNTIQNTSLSDLSGNKNSLGYIKDYLCKRIDKSMVKNNEKKLLVSMHMHTMEWDCETVAEISDQSLDILYNDLRILFDRVNAEKMYRQVRREEKEMRRKEAEITAKK